MRFRILHREKGAPRRPAPVPEPPAAAVPPRAAELETPMEDTMERRGAGKI